APSALRALQILSDQALEKRNGDVLVINFSGLGAKIQSHRHRLLLRMRRERPCRRAADKRDELAPSKANAHLALPLCEGTYRGRVARSKGSGPYPLDEGVPHVL